MTFEWNGSDNTDVYSYILEGKDSTWSSWTSAKSITYPDLDNGNYTFKVKAKDTQGYYDLTPATRSFTVQINYLLDQQQTRYDKSNGVYSTRWSAQSFKPTLGLLTKVNLYVGKTGSPPNDLVVSIRSSLTGSDLVSISKSSSGIPSGISWIEFDLPDYSVTPGNTYYIVVRTSASYPNNYSWCYSSNDYYANGSFWMSTNSGSSWTEYSNYDFCFKTFGGTNPSPNTPSIPSGPTNLIKNVAGYYNTSATDPDAEQVQYMFDWNASGSHDYSDWTGCF